MPPRAPRQVSKSRFKAQALELFRQVEASGEPLVVTDHGRPTLELRGSVLRFDDPFAPACENDWQALA
ncbi:MAG: type II toxin-antitoxin system Phd/YefM family antitoxin [Cyanobacteria bacterium]|nr:type II toxin-antitoxin system Phd/YefM family antitoxin [Cyanobacteriota bacterium]